MSQILIGKGSDKVYLLTKYANRHGMVAGATGTGKTVSLMLMAEGFSRLGVPVVIADVKGDLAGMSQPGAMSDKLKARIGQLGIDWKPSANPVVFWDLYSQQGQPIRTTISEMGPTLLARILELNDTQSGVLEVVFKFADDQGLLMLDLKDLRAVLNHVADNAKAISAQYGLVAKASIAAVQRGLLSLEQAGGDDFFGEPALDLEDLMRQDMSGRGIVNVIVADKLVLKPRLYTTFLLFLLSELFEKLPEVGDLDQPKLVFFFDEAHLLFDDAPAALLQRVEQVVRLIRSKGVGVYFCSQNPDDLPDVVLSQMGNRIQHALRAFTPRDQKAVRAAAETFVPNPKLDVTRVIGELGIGEALVSTLQDKGVPLPVERVLISTPECRLGAITDAERGAVRSRSPTASRYATTVDRESAYERLTARAQQSAVPPAGDPASQPANTAGNESSWMQTAKNVVLGTGRRQGILEAMAKSMARNAGSTIVRGVLGSILGRR
ncbi:MAG: helicase HerA-like domain-containing protein [Lysobacterales bacterium]